MIGVVCGREDAAVFAEFFELFKTPWELYEHGRDYDVVLAGAGDVPELDAGLLVIHGAREARGDDRFGAAGVRFSGGVLRHRGTRLPIYGALRTFVEREPGTAYVHTDDDAVAGVRIRTGELTVVRLGYDLASEVRSLLSAGQPVEHAGVPAVDVHIAMLRALILEAGLSLVEIPPAPAGADFAVCLTHDIDFAGIRHHRLDHTMWGFLYRATIGTVRRVARGQLSLARCAASWRAAASLPLVYLGWVKDFWDPFDWYLRTEHGLPATYFLIPFKRRPGERVTAGHAARRGAAYDLADVAAPAVTLGHHGCELAVHGIDAWHSVDKGRAERERVAALSGATRLGVRMHWLLRDEHTPRVLEDAGYAWDSSQGYNETVGYLNGATQPFRPAGATSLLELPLHIQDGALFYPGRLNLSEAEAWLRCQRLIANAKAYGGVLTVLWHDRSHAPERFWGDFYTRFVDALKSHRAWFATAGDVVGWFAKRRQVRFERSGTGIRLRYDGDAISPALTLRIHGGRSAGDASEPGPSWTDIPWAGGDLEEVERRLTHAARHDTPSTHGPWDVIPARYLPALDDVARLGDAASLPAATAGDSTAARHAARTIACSLLEYCRTNDWAGHDPYDALNSRLLGACSVLDTKPVRLVLTQALKRSPVDIRDLALVPRTQNAKALGLFLASLLKLARAGVPNAGALVEPMIERLIAHRSPGTSQWCWGYSFPWQTRTSVVPRGEPNLVCTSFVGGALLDAAEQGDRRCLDMATSAAEWIAGDLYREHGDGPGFAYPLPSTAGRIHNANLLGAAFLCRVARLTAQSSLMEPALRVARASTSHQRADGSWPYGDGPHQGWIDNFHTGYNLCALASIGRDAETDEFEASLRRGLAFYRRHFFRRDGAPGYFHDRTYPIDTHCVAQSIITLVELQGRHPDNVPLAASVFRWAIAHLWDRRGFFYYRKLRLCTIRTSYMRWSQAWMLLALATLVDHQSVRVSPVNEAAATVSAR